MSLFEFARRLYLRATTYPAKNPELSTDTATCAAQCGQPLVLGEPHYTVVRTAEVVEADGTVAPLDGDELAFVHVGCWPDESVPLVIEARIGGPDMAAVRRAAVRP